jgi:3-hydroxyisobutyrate dehydrogenase
MQRIDSLNNFIKKSWNLLFRAAQTRKGDLQKGIIATQNASSLTQRVVVLRACMVDKRQLIFFTDSRSPKVRQMRKAPEVSWLFWDASRKLQLRLNGIVSFRSEDSDTKEYWDKLPVSARKSYATVHPPSSPILQDSQDLPSDWEKMDKAATDRFFDNFLVVVTTVDHVQCLHLHAEGHQHARFTWEEDKWEGQWLAP